MIKLIRGGCYYMGGALVKESQAFLTAEQKAAARKGTMAYRILRAHNKGTEEDLKLKFDAIASHDITYVGIIQTAKASGLKEFPLSYTLTNCHNSLCAVGGTINEDDHVFGLSAAKKYGANFVPPHIAVIHQYMREMEARVGRMILGSDSHTRYGALGTLAVGEGGPELVKQILCQTYDIKRPEVVAVYLRGNLKKGVGPQDVAIALCGAVFKNGFVKNKILEFVGPGIKNLSMDYRNGIDVMTTETACLSSIWETDEKTREYYKIHGREGGFAELHPEDPAYYDYGITINLSTIEPMIALPFHPSNAYTIRELVAHPQEILAEVEAAGRKLRGDDKFTLTDKIRDGGVYVDQGVIAGCAGGMYENIAEAYEILKGGSTGADEFSLSVYPSSQPVYKALVDNRRPVGRGRRRQDGLLRPLLRRGRRPGQQRPLHPPHDAQLREPRGEQARAGPARFRRPHGRALHRRDGGKRRQAYPRHRGRIHQKGQKILLRRGDLPQARLSRRGEGAGGCRAQIRSEHR